MRSNEVAKSSSESRARAVVVWTILALIWGSTWMFIKIGLRDLPPITFVSARFVVAILSLLVVVKIRGARFPRTRKAWALLAFTGVLSFAVNYGLLFWGENYVSSGLAALLQATIPLFGLLVAHKFLPSEPLNAVKLGGVALGLAGVAVIFSNQMRLGDRYAIYGGAAIIIGAFCVALANVLVKARAQTFDISTLAAGQMMCGLLPLTIVALAKEGSPLKHNWTPSAIFCTLYLALVGTVVAFLLYYWLVRHIKVTNTMLISLVTPVIAVLLGFLLLDEQVTWRILAGGALILAGISVIVFRRRDKPKSERGTETEIIPAEAG